MQTPIAPSFRFTKWVVAVFMMSFGLSVVAQRPAANSIEVQREAMHKLAFLVGRWSGPVTILPGQGEALHLTQTEDLT